MTDRPARPVRDARPREPEVDRPRLSPAARGVRTLVATCAALTVAVAVLGGYLDPGQRPATADAEGRATLSGSPATTSPGSDGPTPTPPASLEPEAPTPGAPEPATPAPADPADGSVQGGVVTPGPVDVIGVASYNVFGYRPEGGLAADLRALTARDDVDLVGWQETDQIADLFPALDAQGWSTRYFPDGGRENAISWRRSEFALVGARSVLVHRGADAPLTPKPFPDRYVTSVVLRYRASGERLTLFDTHVNQYSEDLADPGSWRSNLNAVRAKEHLAALADLWREADTRWVIGTGDFNFDYRADSRVRPPQGISRTFAGLAQSSYQALGLRGLPPTHRLSGRWIDYVLAGQAALDAGHLEFRSERALAGYGSDHLPLLVRLALS